MKSIAIILPCHNSGEHLENSIKAILNRTKYPFKLILVESESTDGTAEVCDKYAKENENIEVIHTKKEGITKALNTGIKYAGDLDVYLTQDDVIIPDLYKRDWLSILVENSKLKNCGIVTTINGGGISGPEYLENLKWVGTWSLFIPRSTIEKVGLFDENFSPGPGDDVDYTYRIIKAGLMPYEAQFWVDHHRMTENFNDDIEFQKRKNAGYFRKKHNILPYWEEFEFDGEKFLLNYKSTKYGGCFHKLDVVESPETCLKIKELTKNFKEEDIFLDIGAHVGLMSLMCQGGWAIAFEPTEEIYDILENNRQINNFHKNIRCVNMAVLDKEAKYNVEVNKENQGNNKAIKCEDGDSKSLYIDLIAFEGNIKLIKIDTEGSDYDVIKGAIKTIKKHKPIIITETYHQEMLDLIGYHKTGTVDNNHILEANHD